MKRLAVLVLVVLVAQITPVAATSYPTPTPVVLRSKPGVPKFLVRCAHSHFAADDPIVHPGQPGASHDHEFFGSTTTDAYSTVQTLIDGGNSCRVTDDDSAYWFPALIENGVRVPAVRGQFYYLARRVDDAGSVRPFPEGFRMVSDGPVRFNCGPGTPDVTAPPQCPPGQFRALLDFPECNDGRLDSPDHRSHMAYATGGACPSSHPVVLPALQAGVHYPSDGGPDVTFSSGPPGSFHGDFMNGWHPKTQALAVAGCIHAAVTCTEVTDQR